MSYVLGAKALKRLALEQDPYTYYQAKLSVSLFKGDQERALFEFVDAHYREYHAVPSIQLLETKFPFLKEVDVADTSKYYLAQVDKRYAFDELRGAMEKSSAVLKANSEHVDEAASLLAASLSRINQQRYRDRVIDLGVEAPMMLLKDYHGLNHLDLKPMYFGWPFLDEQGGAVPGDVVSYVGRPAQGKTYFMLNTCLYDWMTTGANDLFVSMEMSGLAICKRLAAMYTEVPIKQLQLKAFSSETYEVFRSGLKGMSDQAGHLYVVDGNLRTNADEIYALAEALGCRKIWIDGGYLVRHSDKRLNRYERVAENAEYFKKRTGDDRLITSVSWQFARTAVKDKKKFPGAKPTMDDIGYSDVIGQVSSIIIGLLQEESVETIMTRELDLLKGRDGQIGKWKVNWNFDVMDFSEVKDETDDKETLDFV